jgi:excisionase family DNA binding protein
MSPMKRPAQHPQPISLPLDSVARRWGLARREIRQLLQTGQLPFEQVRGQLRVPLTAIQKYETKTKPPVR